MFHDPRTIKPDAYITCNGFVRADDKETPAKYLPSFWRYPPAPGYVYPTPHQPYTAPFPDVVSVDKARGYVSIYPRKSPSSRGGESHKKPSCRQHSSVGSQSSRHSTCPASASSSAPKSNPIVEYPSNIAINYELLWHRSWTASTAGIVWDIARPPSVARTITQRLTIAQPNFAAAAMQKSVDNIDLWTDHAVLACYMHKWGPIPVPKTKITILDLLRAIHEYLSVPLTETDLKFIYSTPQNIGLLENARERRVRDGFEAVYEVAIKGPFRRSDVLGGHRRFQGIRAVKRGDGTNRLYFNLGPGPIPRL